jgi:hypothetical protein
MRGRWRTARRSRSLLALVLVAITSTGAIVVGPVPDVYGAGRLGELAASSADVIWRAPRHVVAGDLPTTTSSGSSAIGRQPWSDGLGLSRTDGANRATASTTLASDPAVASTTGAAMLTEPEFFPGLFWGSTDPPAGFSNPMVAVGPDHVIQTIDELVSITDRTGVQQALVSVVDFFGLTMPGVPLSWGSDVQVVYDSLHARWLAVEWSLDCSHSIGANAIGHGYLDLAVSDSADPLQGWTIYSVGRSDRSPIRPALGTSTDKVVISGSWTQMMDPGASPIGCGEGAPDATEVVAFSWSQLVAGGTVAAQFFTSGLGGTDELSGEVAFWRPAVASPATSATIFLIGRGRFTLDGYYATITGNPATGTAAVSAALNLAAADVISPFAEVPSAKEPDPGWTLQTEAGATSAILQSGRLAFVSGHPCTIAPSVADRVCVRVTELTTGSTVPTRRQDFLIGEAAADNFGGGIAYSGSGDLHVAWARSSEAPGDFASSYAAYHRANDPLNSISAPQLIAAGTATYASTVWALRQGMAPDPQVPSAVWQGNIVSVGSEFYASHVSRLQTAGTTYVPITPTRVLDTRYGTGLSGKFTANTARSWTVAGVGTIPANAVAVTGNVTVTQQEAAGFLAVTPTLTNMPTSSTINFPIADNRANNLAVPLSTTGSLSAVFIAASGKKTHLIFDVTGYFLADDSGATFNPMTPTRVLDTRSGKGLSGKFVSGAPRTLTIAGAYGIPPTATAVTGNVTVTQQSAGGFLTVTKSPIVTPPTSTLNFPVGENRANGLYAPLDGSGALSIVYTGPLRAGTHVILDITGYFVPGTGGLRFVPMNPGRTMDTRSIAVLSGLMGTFAANAARILPVDGHWGVPIGTTAVTGNLTVTRQTSAGHIALSPSAPPAIPATSTLNFPFADNRANGLIAPLNGSGNVYLVFVGGSGQTTHLILDLSGYFD